MKNPLSKEAFADWCDRKPADEVYDYTATSNCAAAQYLKWLGFKQYVFYDGNDLPSGWKDCVNPSPDDWPNTAWTFGALASRLRA